MTQSTTDVRYKLPIIDISGLDYADDTKLAQLAEQIGAACRSKGFFYVVGHGILPSMQEQLFSDAQQLFQLPIEEKESLNKKYSPANLGYEPMKNQTLEPGSPPDLKEGFYIGPEHGPEHPRVKAGYFNFGSNQWPTSLPSLETSALTYIENMAKLAKSLMSLIALSLKLPRDYFDEFCHSPLITLRLLHYPPQPANPEPNEKGCGAHTDFGGLTLLLQDPSGGLQVWEHSSEQWIDATPISGSYVVNLGDMIARWTNDKYRSTLHRVINSSGKERYSIPFFFTGNPEQKVECITSCLGEGEIPKYSVTTVDQHMRNMYQRTYTNPV